MKHILYLTYGFPPVNNMAAQRAILRVKALDMLGYKVSVVTRPWTSIVESKNSDLSTEKITVENIFSNTRVYRVPFGLHQKGTFAGFQNKLLSSNDLISRNLAFFLCPLEGVARLRPDIESLERLLESKPDIIFASGGPWSIFELGVKLASHFNSKYVAEYRDSWGHLEDRFKRESNNSYNDNFFSQLKRRYALYLEKKFNHKADLLVTVSEPILENIRQVTGVKNGLVVNNGYDPDELESVKAEHSGPFTLTYIGTIYASQRAEVFFKALENFIDRNNIPLDTIKVKMIGSRNSHGFEKVMNRIATCRHHNRIIEYTDRLDSKASLRIQKSSNILLYFSHEGKSAGIYSGKIFEYIASGIPILFAPSDHGVVAELINRTQTGAVCDSVEDVVSFLESTYRNWKDGKGSDLKPVKSEIEKYSYLNQTRKLVKSLESL